jgi:hypothetical protein
LILQFYHSSPGTGTRVARIDLNTLPQSETIGITIRWTPAEIALYAGPIGHPSQVQSSKGSASKKAFRIGKDRAVYQVGDEGVDVTGFSIYHGDKAILLSTGLVVSRAR